MSDNASYLRECNEKKRLFCNDMQGMAMELLAAGHVEDSNKMVDRMLECRLMDPDRFFFFKMPVTRKP